MDQMDPRYQAMSEAVQAPEERARERKLEEIANLQAELAKAINVANGVNTEFWRVLREDYIKPNTSIRKIHASAGEKRIEAVGETKVMQGMLDWIENKIKSIPSISAKIAKLEKELSQRQPLVEPRYIKP